MRLAWDAAVENVLDFSEEPFDLGSYHDIASFFIERGGQAENFSLGLTLPMRAISYFSPLESLLVTNTTFIDSREDHPNWGKKSITISDPEISIQVTKDPGGNVLRASVNFPSSFTYDVDIPEQILEQFGWSYTMISAYILVEQESGLSEEDQNALRTIQTKVQSTLGSRPTAMSPVRTRPKRTYDPRTPAFSPEGQHTPMILPQVLEASGTEQESLVSFGNNSGLFTDLRVKRFGNEGGLPFQIQAEMRGHLRNIIDVGYGVSQSLPIVMGTMNTPHNATVLIQQPEVHLHPKAQAEMGTFFVEQMQQRSAPIIVETHSDYMIDRVRLMIRRGRIQKDDVKILYFSPKETDVDIIPIGLRDDGSIIEPPEDYRKFFLDEQYEFFS